MQRKNCTAVSPFWLKDRSNQELLDGVKHLVGRHRTVTARLIAHLAEIYARKLHVVEGFSYLGDYCVSALGMSEDEAHRRAHAAVLAQKCPVILDMLLEGSIHLTTLRIIGKCLTPQNHREVLEAARGKNKTELEHLAAALCPKQDVPTVLRKLPEPRLEILPNYTEEMVQRPAGIDEVPATTTLDAAIPVTPDRFLEGRTVDAPSFPSKSRLAPLSPHRYNLQVTVDEETYSALKQLQDLLRHQVRNGDLARIIKDSVLERLERVKREKFGHTKRPRKAREQESWIELEKTAVEVRTEAEPLASAKVQARSGGEKKLMPEAKAEEDMQTEDSEPGSAAIALGRFNGNSRHIPAAVKREVWERDKGRCAFVSRTGRRCSETGRLEFHHIHAYALGGVATVENIALRCRTHNAYEGISLFGERRAVRFRVNAGSGAEGPSAVRTTGSNRPGAIVGAGPATNAS